ncbi:FAM96B [Fusarium albosuccineum]|uniref:FAM96B n=1 Tax=Fusarium albosuccineum TaxID=1237068 RepID=A0A8H4K4D4_9HYPO|nr:FAM96B [Fusarium albosuccineum]
MQPENGLIAVGLDPRAPTLAAIISTVSSLLGSASSPGIRVSSSPRHGASLSSRRASLHLRLVAPAATIVATIAMAALDNANPTILSASQLPTRQKKADPRRGPESKYDDLIFARPSYLSGPFYRQGTATWPRGGDWQDEFASEAIDEQEIYDPEHPVSLGQLSVINLSDIHITPSPTLGVPDPNTIVQVAVEITPTITHCSLATVIGLGVRVRLEQALPPNYRVDVTCKENSHNQDDQVNKQLGDKERVAAALENDTLKGVLDKMLETCA